MRPKKYPRPKPSRRWRVVAASTLLTACVLGFGLYSMLQPLLGRSLHSWYGGGAAEEEGLHHSVDPFWLPGDPSCDLWPPGTAERKNRTQGLGVGVTDRQAGANSTADTSDCEYMNERAAELLEAPILIVSATGHYLGDYEQRIRNCTFHGWLLDCDWQRQDGDNIQVADALWYHGPHQPHPGSELGKERFLHKHHPMQLLVMASMESDAYYPQQKDPAYLAQFDLTMTYRLDSDIPILYYPHDEPNFAPPIPTSEKKNAVVFINSNCGTINERQSVMQALMDLKRVQVDSYGSCLNNMGHAEVNGDKWQSKRQIMRQYKFCVAMENSNSVDYVTEKIWHAFQEGCVPIYLGAPNIEEDFLPDPSSAINYAKLGTPEALADELERLMADDQAYEAMLEWKARGPEASAPGFQRLMEWGVKPGGQCRLCQRIAQHRLQNSTY